MPVHNQESNRSAVNTKTTVPLDVVPERRTERCSPRFRPGGRFCELRFRYPSSPTGREGEISRPLDHMRQIPFIHSAQHILLRFVFSCQRSPGGGRVMQLDPFLFNGHIEKDGNLKYLGAFSNIASLNPFPSTPFLFFWDKF